MSSHNDNPNRPDSSAVSPFTAGGGNRRAADASVSRLASSADLRHILGINAMQQGPSGAGHNTPSETTRANIIPISAAGSNNADQPDGDAGPADTSGGAEASASAPVPFIDQYVDPVAEHPTRPAPEKSNTAAAADALPGALPGAPADRRAEVARWVVSLSEPLIGDEERRRATADMARFVERNSDWAIAYLAGVLHDLVHTLPADDPWRNLSALIDLDQVATGLPTKNKDKRLVRRGDTAPVPARTGALNAEGRPFGTRADAQDLMAAGVSDVTTDIGLAALAVNLSPLSAALVAFGSHDARTLQFSLGQTYHHLWLAHFASVIEETAGRALLDAATAAIRWVLHRRRAYTGAEDNFMTVLGFAWISKADRVNAGTNILSEMGLAQQGAVDGSMYRFLTGDDEDFGDGMVDDF